MAAFRAWLAISLALAGAAPETRAAEDEAGSKATLPATSTTDEAPLVAYSLELGIPEETDRLEKSREVRAAAHELERNPPPVGAECVKTLGASRFAEQYRKLAWLQFEAGDFEAALESYKAALECRPRVPTDLAGITLAYLALGRAEELRPHESWPLAIG